ncbi:MAG: HAD family phosphatase [Kofleriaceae bacterium]|nr:HAD family phosphatase [Kofleriaceae bacterium]
MHTIDHIVFDIGRVLLDYDPARAFQTLMPDLVARRTFLAEVCSPAWNLEQDRGRSWPDAEAELIALHPAQANLIRAFRANWHAMIGPPIDENVALLRRFVAEGRDVTLLTNFAVDTFEEALARWPFLAAPRGATVSGKVGIIKPDAAIYQRHAQQFGLAPNRTLFIDDNADNVAAAHACGWHAVRFTDVATLQRDVAAFGLLP